MSFKTYEQIQFAQSIYVPRPFTWENYTGLWLETRFPLWFRNSVVTAVVVTIITTVIACLSGYAVARLRFPGREAIATLILLLYLVPPALLYIPLYRVLAELGATNSLIASFLSYPTFTVPVGLNLLIYGDVFHWGQLIAASDITTVPMVAVYMFIHRWMVEGLAAGAVKG